MANIVIVALQGLAREAFCSFLTPTGSHLFQLLEMKLVTVHLRMKMVSITGCSIPKLKISDDKKRREKVDKSDEK